MSTFDGLTVPGPTITGTTEPFWDALNDGRLRVQRCTACDRWVFYPREICPHCWSTDMTWADASGRGRIRTYSDVVRPGHPGWAPVAPYVVAVIALDEGPTMLGLLLASEDHRPEIGTHVVFTPTDIGGRVVPTFTPEDQHNQLTDNDITTRSTT